MDGMLFAVNVPPAVDIQLASHIFEKQGDRNYILCIWPDGRTGFLSVSDDVKKLFYPFLNSPDLPRLRITHLQGVQPPYKVTLAKEPLPQVSKK